MLEGLGILGKSTVEAVCVSFYFLIESAIIELLLTIVVSTAPNCYYFLTEFEGESYYDKDENK